MQNFQGLDVNPNYAVDDEDLPTFTATDNVIREEAFSVFVAPVIHLDTVEVADWQKHKYNADILPFNINEFIEKINSSDHVSQLSGNFFIKLKI